MTDNIVKSIKPPLDPQLSLFEIAPWPDSMRIMPNDYSRSALFTARSKSAERLNYKDYVIFSLNKDVKITYRGEELRAEDDELVWQQILEYAKHLPLGDPLYFTIYQLCKDIGWDTSGHYYKKAEECLKRLKATAISISSKQVGLDCLSMIKKFQIREPKGIIKKRTCCVEIDTEIYTLFVGSRYTRFVWSVYRQLSPISRRLYDYLASHRQPFPLKLESFQLLCSSDTATLPKWKQQVKKACIEIEKHFNDIKVWVDKDTIYFSREKQTTLVSN